MLARLRERQACQRAHLQIKLRLVAGVHRVVAAVVRAGGHFVDHQLAAFEQEEFHAEHAHVVEAFGNRAGRGHRLSGHIGRHSPFVHAGHGQNAVAVQVQLHREIHHLPIGATRHDDRALGLQRQHFFEHAGHALQLSPSRRQFFAGFDADLTLAVVAHARGLQNTGQQIVTHSRQLGGGLDHGMRRDRHAAAHKVGLLGGAVLRNRDRLGGRGHRTVCTQRQQGRCRHVFKLGGDGRAALHQLRQALLIQVVGLDVMVAHQSGGAGRIGVEHSGEVTHGLRRLHEHAAQLAPAHHAQRGHLAIDHGARQNSAAHAAPTGGRVMARAMAVCSARKASSF